MKKSFTTKAMTVDDLAVLMKGQFDRIDERFNGIDGRFNNVDRRLENVEKDISHIKDDVLDIKVRTSTIERDTAAIKHHAIYREDFLDLESRVKLLETKMGVKSGR